MSMTTEELNSKAKQLATKKFEEQLNGGDWFSICDVSNYLDDMDVNWDRTSEYEVLSKFHCIHWKDMTKEVRSEIVARCTNFVAEAQLRKEQPVKGFWKGLFS